MTRFSCSHCANSYVAGVPTCVGCGAPKSASAIRAELTPHDPEPEVHYTLDDWMQVLFARRRRRSNVTFGDLFIAFIKDHPIVFIWGVLIGTMLMIALFIRAPFVTAAGIFVLGLCANYSGDASADETTGADEQLR